MSLLPSVRLIANKTLSGNLRGTLQPSALSGAAGALAPFRDHYLYASVRVRIHPFLSVSAFSIEFLSIV